MVDLFFSYSHADESYRQELEKHLALLRREGVIAPWHDRRIGAGKDFQREISENLERAEIVLLLISPDFLHSDYCFDIEMKRAMEKHEGGTARVVPVILRPCDWHTSPFGRLNAVPRDGKAVSSYANQDEAFLEVATAIRAASREIEAARSAPVDREQRRGGRVVPSVERPATAGAVRIKRQFTQQEKDEFLEESFEAIASFFEASLAALSQENRHVKTKYKRLDATHFSATAYVNGETRSYCRIWVGGSVFNDGIAYSTSERGGDNTFNEVFSVVDDGFTLSLKPLGMGTFRSESTPMTPRNAAESLWRSFLEPLQR